MKTLIYEVMHYNKIPEFPCLVGRQGFAASGMTFAREFVIAVKKGIYFPKQYTKMIIDNS